MQYGTTLELQDRKMDFHSTAIMIILGVISGASQPIHSDFTDFNKKWTVSSYSITAVPPNSTLTAVLSFMTISPVRRENKGAIDDVTKYVDWKTRKIFFNMHRWTVVICLQSEKVIFTSTRLLLTLFITVFLSLRPLSKTFANCEVTSERKRLCREKIQQIICDTPDSYSAAYTLEQCFPNFRLFWFPGTLGQPREVCPKFRNFILENFCSIRLPTRNLRIFGWMESAQSTPATWQKLGKLTKFSSRFRQKLSCSYLYNGNIPGDNENHDASLNKLQLIKYCEKNNVNERPRDGIKRKSNEIVETLSSQIPLLLAVYLKFRSSKNRVVCVSTKPTVRSSDSTFTVLSVTSGCHCALIFLIPVWCRYLQFTSHRSNNLPRVYFNIFDTVKDNDTL